MVSRTRNDETGLTRYSGVVKFHLTVIPAALGLFVPRGCTAALASRSRLVLAVVVAVVLDSGTSTAQADEQTYGQWTVRCEATATAAARECIMFQNLVLRTGGQPVLQFAVGLAPADGTPTVVLSLPLGIALPPGVAIRIDDGTAAKFPVERCEPDGCRAGMKLRPATVKQLGAGDKLTITFFDGERKPIEMPLSLAGFTAAYQALAASRAAETAAAAAAPD